MLVAADPSPEAAGTDAALPITRGGTRFVAGHRGDRYRVGTTVLRVLSDGRGLHPTGADPNNDSLVVRAEMPGVSMLFTGDIEQPAQQALLRQKAAVDVDVLKVPHHGSADFLPEFFAAVSPTVAIISVGADNDYGHPAPSTLRWLTVERAVVLRTDRQGMVAVVAGPSGMTVFGGDSGHL